MIVYETLWCDPPKSICKDGHEKAKYFFPTIKKIIVINLHYSDFKCLLLYLF